LIQFLTRFIMTLVVPLKSADSYKSCRTIFRHVIIVSNKPTNHSIIHSFFIHSFIHSINPSISQSAGQSINLYKRDFLSRLFLFLHFDLQNSTAVALLTGETQDPYSHLSQATAFSYFPPPNFCQPLCESVESTVK